MTNLATHERADHTPSAWAPFGYPAFSVLWIATVISNVGTWMNEVGAGWLMTELSPSPLVVASVQAAATLPIFLFALLAGAIADIVDRRKMLITVNALTFLVVTALATLVYLDMMTPALLLVFIFLGGTGAAFMAPAWQAIVPKLVPREALPPAIALNSMGINVSRAIGPALAGVLIVGLGLWSPFAINAASFLVILAALWWWTPPQDAKRTLPTEKVGRALLSGLRYAANSKPLMATLIRAAAFFVCASAYWAMLPLIARDVLNGGATLYGVLLGAVGAGAVGGALILPRLRGQLGSDLTVAAGTICTAIVLAAFALLPYPIAAVGASAMGGVGWIAVLSSLHVSTQTSLPDWVRARGLSIFLTVFFGAMSGGSLIWGQVASLFGIPTALLIASAGALVLIPITWRAKLNKGTGADLSPSGHWPEPDYRLDSDAGARPVMIQITYAIAQPDAEHFIALMHELVRERRRGGGYNWSLMEDSAAPGTYVETWFEPSLTDHMRHHARVSEADRALQERVLALQAAGQPDVRHFIQPNTKGDSL
ncbi:MAG: MFS transporter [Pseudomonadota bacterium]